MVTAKNKQKNHKNYFSNTGKIIDENIGTNSFVPLTVACKLKGPIKELLRTLQLNFSFPESQITDPSVNASIQKKQLCHKKSPVSCGGV
jgi:hypothetical protein